MPTLAEHLQWRVDTWRHRRVARGILKTPAIVPRDDGVLILSMIGHGTLLPYLVAVKSLHRALGRGRVAVIDDGTLTDGDRAILHAHCGDPEIVPITAIDTGPCPRGGTWERLLTILDRRARDYVIQLDSDTVTTGPVPEVIAAIEARRSFALKGEAAAELTGAGDYAAALPPLAPPMHVQNAAERALGRLTLPMLAAPRYIRGCSAFTGFAPSGAGRALAEAFSRAMAADLGEPLWRAWGSEQVTSNFVIANEPEPLLLPYDRYLNFWNAGLPTDRRLIHYIGACRFAGGAYVDATRAAIAG